MNSEALELKITGWKYSGFKVPNVEVKIEDPGGKRYFTLYQMLSGEGKTTTLNLLRNSFYDINKKLNATEIKAYIDSVRTDDNTIDQGIFEVNFKINNKTNYRVSVNFDYINNKISYTTNQGDRSGYQEGLILPESISRFITPEFIDISFFDLEFTESLYVAQKQQTDRIIKKLCKLDYLDEVAKNLEIFLKEFRKKNQGKLASKDLEQDEMRSERLKKHFEEVEIKAQKQKDKRANLNKKIKDIKLQMEKIKNEKLDIKNKINKAKENLDLKNESLRESFELAFHSLKNPMTINNDLKNELLEFENNLTKKRIPKGVGEAFFDELIDSNECLCGHTMTNEMKSKIKESKNLYLDEENIAILNPIKTSIKNFEGTQNVDEVFKNIIKFEREVNIAKNQYNSVYENTEDEKFNKYATESNEIEKELEKIDDWMKNYEKPFSPNDPVDTECKKTLEKRIYELEESINKRSKAVEESRKIKLLKEWLEEIQINSLNKISKKIIEDINKEVKRVLPLEPIYVSNIKDKITLETEEGRSRSRASAGQMARIAYLFLINLLNKSNLKFPLIVDSPVTALDGIGRKEIAEGLVKDHQGQYIGFIFDVEKQKFSEILEEKLKSNINLITVFNKSEASQHMTDLAIAHKINTDEFDNGVVSYNPEFFNKFEGVKTN